MLLTQPAVHNMMVLTQPTVQNSMQIAQSAVSNIVLLIQPTARSAILPIAQPHINTKLMFLSEWREFPSAPCLAKKKKNLMTARVSMLLKSRASLTCFLPGQAKDLSAPRYIFTQTTQKTWKLIQEFETETFRLLKQKCV